MYIYVHVYMCTYIFIHGLLPIAYRLTRSADATKWQGTKKRPRFEFGPAGHAPMKNSFVDNLIDSH